MQNLEKLQEKLGYKFKNQTHLKIALTHKSAKNGHNNERLEFLGDAVMDLIVGEYLFKKFSSDEGDLSKLRAALVNESSFSKFAKFLGIGENLNMSLSEERNGGREKPSLLSDAFEAIMGAVYLESGLQNTARIAIAILEILYPRISFNELVRDYKTALQELTQAKFGVTPEYILLGSSGPDHKKSFEMAALVGGKWLSSAVGASKKEAEQKCAQIAIDLLQNSASHGTSAQNSEQTACASDAQSGANCAQDGKKGLRGGSGRAQDSKKGEHNNRGGTPSAKKSNERNGRDTDRQGGGEQGGAL
ncbi:ribonuclease III [Campylobacter gracilis]|uniref:Ribonuclease 3 n=1 Tax=Campylobacter gracilis RM3268 TaxID=553220 RepID=C8PI53_9BACT|nr:ribonuclease III [Campylobacter gracilis]EEV17443.1 ribonuclease III [Campylobacter gracilis RM3268]SUW77949.1 ribonuclease III [Campylobacter gracilis]